MNENIKKQILYRIKHEHNDRMNKLHGCKVLLNVVKAVDFYKKIILDKFNVVYSDLFYHVVERTIQWYNKWYFDVNHLQYEQYENKTRFEMCEKQLDLQKLYFIYSYQKKKYCLDVNQDKQLIMKFLQQCYRKTTGYENFI